MPVKDCDECHAGRVSPCTMIDGLASLALRTGGVMSFLPDSVRWNATLLLLTWAFAPFARLVAGRLPDRGAFVAKPIGLLAVVWPTWFLAGVSPFPYTATALWSTLGLAALVGWAVLIRCRAIDRSWILHLVAAEIIALVAFVAYIGIRGFTPQITGTEKPMDVAFLSSSARATDMPPADPWMAGESINYYYLGYLLNGSLARLSAVPTWVGFNLALASTFAMTIAAAVGLGYGAVRDRLGRSLGIAAGGLTAFLIVIAGNLRAPIELLRDPDATWSTFWWQNIGWESSRVIVDSAPGSPDPVQTINEFPSFSFILGDLHPHVMALPFTLVSLVIAVNLFRRREDGDSIWLRFLPIAAAGAVIGALYPLNSWDYPTYLAAAVVALLFAVGWTRETLYRVLVLGTASIIAWAPFWVTFVPFAGANNQDNSGLENLPLVGRITSTLGTYSGDRTSAGEFLTMFGLPWAVALVILSIELVRDARSGSLHISKPVAGAALVLALLALGVPAPVLILAGAPLAAAGWLLMSRDRSADPELTIISTLLAAGFGLILITEFFYVQDVFSGRLNTLFKVYYQVWTLFGVAVAVSLIRLWKLIANGRNVRILLAASGMVILFVGIAYPVISFKTWTEWSGPREWRGLDGAKFIDGIAPDDMAAIEWLSVNAREDDVILEAPGCSYTVNSGVPTGRIAAFTGVPAIIGWTGHEHQWRGGQPELEEEISLRVQAVETMFEDPTALSGFNRYDVTLLYVGDFEREGASGCEVAGPFAAVNEPGYPGDGWTEVFASGNSRIYRRSS